MKSAKIIGRERARLDMFFFLYDEIQTERIPNSYFKWKLQLNTEPNICKCKNAATGESINFHRKPYKKVEIINSFAWLNSKIICF